MLSFAVTALLQPTQPAGEELKSLEAGSGRPLVVLVTSSRKAVIGPVLSSAGILAFHIPKISISPPLASLSSPK